MIYECANPKCQMLLQIAGHRKEGLRNYVFIEPHECLTNTTDNSKIPRKEGCCDKITLLEGLISSYDKQLDPIEKAITGMEIERVQRGILPVCLKCKREYDG